MFRTAQTPIFSVTRLLVVMCSLVHEEVSAQFGRSESQIFSCSKTKGDENMLGIIAAVLIVLWLLGFFAFHVTTGFIHIALVVGLILLVLHFVTGRTASA